MSDNKLPNPIPEHDHTQATDEPTYTLTPEAVQFIDLMRACGCKDIYNPRGFKKFRAILDAAEKECEWRGILLRDHQNLKFFRLSASGQWRIEIRQVGRILSVDVSDNDGIPARPSDEIVAKIKEAVNG